jgi:hypothetical protein
MKVLALIGGALVSGLAVASPAGAIGLTPQQTGEIDVGLGCLDGCLTINPLLKSITSLVDTTTGAQSRLFVDYFGPGDGKDVYDDGTTKVVFKKRDTGTNPEGYWFRPSEVTEEKGQLEVGTYKFEFSETLAALTIDFFDTEKNNQTGILAVNGVPALEYVNKGKNGNIATKTLSNVDSVVLKLGFDNPKKGKTGDGVDFRLAAEPVPEPLTLLGTMAAAGMGYVARRRQLAQKAADA